ncbi:MAG: dimethyl sulfoxide reductase anchor subunit family protein [Rudaea sp.]
MNPAFSVIFFTVVSGSGYGLWFLLGLGLALDPHIVGRNEALTVLVVGAVFVAAGLLASTLHLGQPQRAWRAFSQWRSSWLSREGVASVCSFVPALALAFSLWRGDAANGLRWLGAALAVLAIVTVCCTAKIYTSLKTIHAWHNRYVLPGYLLLGLLGGAAWLLALHTFFEEPQHVSALHALLCWLVIATGLLGYGWKRAYWHFIDTTRHPASVESATGLGRFGAVRSVEAPHTEENYLTREMGFALARKHAQRLRGVCLILLGPLTVVLAFAALASFGHSHALASTSAIAAAFAASAGLFVERWLFFAEGKHVVMLYYGAGALPHSP